LSDAIEFVLLVGFENVGIDREARLVARAVQQEGVERRSR
jgi:hypothetical protein